MGQAAHDKTMSALSKGVHLGGLVLHHINPTLINYDFRRYDEWRPEDVVLLDQSTHAQLHAEMKFFPNQYGVILIRALFKFDRSCELFTSDNDMKLIFQHEQDVLERWLGKDADRCLEQALKTM